MLGSSERERVHTRRIVCEAFRRRDGLWEIEATVILSLIHISEPTRPY